MTNQGQSEGFRVLDDFVCEAIHDAQVPMAGPPRQGQNEGMRAGRTHQTLAGSAIAVISSGKSVDEIGRWDAVGRSPQSGEACHGRRERSGGGHSELL